MKKLVSISLVAGILFSMLACQKQQDGYVIKGNVEGMDAGWVSLFKSGEGKELVKIDSAKIVKGKFEMKGKIDLPEFYTLRVNDNGGSVSFFAEKSTITMQMKADSVENASITGSKTQDAYKDYLKGTDVFEKRYQEIMPAYKEAKATGDMAKIDPIREKLLAIGADEDNYTKTYIKNNTKSVIAPYLASKKSYLYTFEEIQALNKQFDASLANSVYVQKLKNIENVLTTVQVGKQAPDFSAADPTGKSFSPANFKGKITLIDFWASWCPDCRKENPNVVAAYKKYAPKGFTVFGVSYDDNKEKWVEAIKKDGLNWTNVSELKKWDNATTKLYAIRSIPANVLIDKEGKIIGRDLFGDALLNKLEEVFNTQPVKK